MSRSLAWLSLALLAAGCYRPRPATVPLHAVEVPGAPADSSCLVLFLPGRGDGPEDFLSNGFPEALRAAGSPCAVQVVDAHLGYYFERTIRDRLREDIFIPAQQRGVKEIWMVGISLGGFGSMLYSREDPGEVAGIVALSPYLGEDEVITEVERAGGLRRWTPPASMETADFRRLWAWLKGYEKPEPGLPELYLGFGASDRFADANGLLAEVLPPDRVITLPGRHNWWTWRRLWEAFLERRVPGKPPEGRMAGGKTS